MQRLKYVCLATVLLFVHALLAQQSQWVHPGSNGRLVYFRGENGVTIPDYSFAGYHSGGVALPTVPAQVNLSPTGADAPPPFSRPSIPSLPVRSTPMEPAAPYNSPKANFTAAQHLRSPHPA
jgi:hypothetical protein